MPKQYRLNGASLEEIRDKAVSVYGPAARIVAAEKVTNPGFGGLFAKDRFEATVEVPDAVPASAPNTHPGLHRSAVAALLADADARELRLHADRGPAPLSTAGADFAGLLVQLGAEIARTAPAVVRPEEPAETRAAVPPVPLQGAGDLVLLLGLGDDALGPALDMSLAAGGCDVRTSGRLTAFGHLHVANRMEATTARAVAVANGQTVLLAYGLGRPREAGFHAAQIAGLGADQVWAVVDARRKPEDTAAWLKALRDGTAVDGLAVVGSNDTLTPDSVDGLGLPVGWRDGRKVDWEHVGSDAQAGRENHDWG